MKKITIIDYGCGNILNLARAIKFLGYEAEITHDKKKILNSSHLILPGVGAFGNAMSQLNKYDLQNTILEYVNLNKPLFGICLGMQILLTESYEYGVHKGLNLIEGKVIKISNKGNKEVKVPHMGWNEIYPNNRKEEWKSKILKSCDVLLDNLEELLPSPVVLENVLRADIDSQFLTGGESLDDLSKHLPVPGLILHCHPGDNF